MALPIAVVALHIRSISLMLLLLITPRIPRAHLVPSACVSRLILIGVCLSFHSSLNLSQTLDYIVEGDSCKACGLQGKYRRLILIR